MNCRDFERLWNDRLDARADPSAADAPLDAHASTCPACRSLAAGYQAVALAARAFSITPLPEVTPDFADRVLAAYRSEPAPVLRFGPLRRLLPLASAAAVLAAGFVGWKAANLGTAPAPDRPAAVARVESIDPDALSAALADATSATLGLAREASAPAARALGAAEQGLAVGPESLSLSASVLPASAAAVWQGVGVRVNEGVRPISGSARSAFGFLIPPPSARGDRPDGAPALPSEGA